MNISVSPFTTNVSSQSHLGLRRQKSRTRLGPCKESRQHPRGVRIQADLNAISR